VEIAKKYNVAASIAGIEKPVIAAVNGDALGQGLELALACDIRIAVQQAHFGFPEVAQGLIPSDGGTQRLPRIIGRGKALEFILTAEIIGAAEALETGLVTKVVPAESLAAEVETLVKAVAGKAPISLRYIKEAINKGLDLTMEQGCVWRPTSISYYTPPGQNRGNQSFPAEKTARIQRAINSRVDHE